MDKVLEKLKQNESETPSKWCEEAEYRRANKSWLRRSQKIAVKILSKMRESGISQTELAQQNGSITIEKNMIVGIENKIFEL